MYVIALSPYDADDSASKPREGDWIPPDGQVPVRAPNRDFDAHAMLKADFGDEAAKPSSRRLRGLCGDVRGQICRDPLSERGMALLGCTPPWRQTELRA